MIDRSGNAAFEAVEASRDGSLTSNLLTATPATPNSMARTPLARVGVEGGCEE